MRANLPDKDYFIGKNLPAKTDVKIIDWKVSGLNGHLFRGYSESLRRNLACKIIPRTNLLHGQDGSEIWKTEVYKANALRSNTVVKFEDIQEWRDSQAGIDCIVLISEFVEGPSLKEFIKDASSDVTIHFIVDWLKTMFNLFNEMERQSVTHGDLHAGNILVEDRSAYDLLGPRYVFRVTDFGVAEATSQSHFKDDFCQLADVLGQLLGAIDYYTQGQKDKFLFNAIRNHFISRHLVEKDLTLDPIARRPPELLKRLLELDADFERTIPLEIPQLLTPFDFLSCEQIGEAPTLLRALYSDRFLGLPDIESQNNVVVTGPRGCGKTTVFRSLNLDHKMQISEGSPDQIQYIGIYYECLDLYFAFPRYKVPSRSEAFDIPIHFITATLLSKLLASLERWARQYYGENFNRIESKAAEDLWEVLGINPPQIPDYATFRAVVAALNKERVKATDRHRFANDQKREIGRCFGPEVLMKGCEVLNKHLSFIGRKPIYFFIDDYSSPKITKDLQANLNRIFMQRTSFCFFKLSTESPVSFAKHDIDDKIYVESREYLLHNLGLVYLHSEMGLKLDFIDDVFRRRLMESQTPFPSKDLSDLVGEDTAINNNELARQIRDNKKPLIWGKEALCRLCSGDIHYLIGLVGNMVRLSGGAEGLEKGIGKIKIPKSNQNKAIREAAGGFLKNLNSIPRFGKNMVSVVEAFGNVAYSHLKYLNSKNESGAPPKQATRIEPYEPLALSQEAQELYDELLRYSVFIEDYRGKSRRGNVVPRLYLRRFLIPHFNLTFSTRDSIELEPADFQKFLLDPNSFEKQLRIKNAADATRQQKNEAKDQLSLSLGDLEE